MAPRPACPLASDDAVRHTDRDASLARLSAITKRYLDEQVAPTQLAHSSSSILTLSSSLLSSSLHSPFSALLAGPRITPELVRPPWVNIGTHHRTFLIDLLIQNFLSNAHSGAQILSLGSGSDSRFWRLKHKLNLTSSWPVLKWIEIDFESINRPKIQNILIHHLLRSSLAQDHLIQLFPHPDQSAQAPSDLISPTYALISGDLREPEKLTKKLRSHALIRSELPTLILAELVFVYLLPDQTRSILKSILDLIQPDRKVMIITYEAMNLNDNFSKIMTQNLLSRGLTLLGFDYNSSIQSQIQRFQSLDEQDTPKNTSSSSIQVDQSINIQDHKQKQNPHYRFDRFSSTDIKTLRNLTDWNLDWKIELERIKSLEFLDEIEELELILKHYCLTWAVRDGIDGDGDQGDRKVGKLGDGGGQSDHQVHSNHLKFHLPW